MENKIYKTETHLHTAETSHCGKIPAKDLIAAYAEKGYSTVFVSDHLDDNIYGRKFCSGPNDYIAGVTRHLRGYYKAKEAGEKYGVTVLSFSSRVTTICSTASTRTFCVCTPALICSTSQKFTSVQPTTVRS